MILTEFSKETSQSRNKPDKQKLLDRDTRLLLDRFLIIVAIIYLLNYKFQTPNILPREILQGRDFVFHRAGKFQ